MKELKVYLLYVISILFYVAAAFYNYFLGSVWLIDSLFSIALLTVIYSLRKRLALGFAGLIAINILLFAHNMGEFGIYSSSVGGIGFDAIMHFTGAVVVGYLMHSFLRRNIPLDREVAVAFLAVSSTMLLSLGVEFTEYTGYVYYGNSTGIASPGDSSQPNEVADSYTDRHYRDTIHDLRNNLLGAIVGSACFVALGLLRRKKAGVSL